MIIKSKKISNNDYFISSKTVKRKVISVSLALFIIMSTLLIPGTVALAAIPTGSSSNTILAANSNNTRNKNNTLGVDENITSFDFDIDDDDNNNNFFFEI